MSPEFSFPHATSASGCSYLPLTPPGSTRGVASPAENLGLPHDELLTSWLTKIKGWYHTKEAKEQQGLCLYGVHSKKLVDEVWRACIELGFKPRYIWTPGSQTLVLTMPVPLHEVIAGNFAYHATNIEHHLRLAGVVQCGVPFLDFYPGPALELDSGREVIPDGSFGINVRSQFGNRPGTIPVVIETAFSQTLPEVQRKACLHLCRSDNDVRAVIIVKLTYSNLLTSKFKARMTTWVREPAVHTLQACQVEAHHHSLPLRTALEEGDGFPQANGATFTCRDSDGTDMTIRCRDERPILLFDESLDTVPHAVLRLHVYDFVHPCVRIPNGRVPEHLEWIPLSLERLQSRIPFALEDYRLKLASRVRQAPEETL